MSQHSIGRIPIGWLLVTRADNLSCIEVLFQVASLATDGKIELNAAENHYRNEDTHRSFCSNLTFFMYNGVANIGYSQL